MNPFFYSEKAGAKGLPPLSPATWLEPKQVKHGNQVIADRLCRLPCEVIDFTAGQDCDEAHVTNREKSVLRRNAARDQSLGPLYRFRIVLRVQYEFLPW